MKTKRSKKRIMTLFLIILLCLAGLGAAVVSAVDAYVRSSVKSRVLTPEEAAGVEGADCVIVLGCKVREDGSLSDMLRDRLVCGVELYRAGCAPKLLMNGDHGRAGYDEVGAMKRYAVENGVPGRDVFMDHAGFSTYETIYRAKEVFKVKKALIVTQGYHLSRALYIAGRLGIEAYGVAADLRTYAGQTARDLRETLANCKDFFGCIFKPLPTYLGDPVPIDGDGGVTDERM